MHRILSVLLSALLLYSQERSQSGLELVAARPMVAQPERAQRAMVASVHPLATEAGLAVLRRGGNAVDAAVAVGAALAVVHPEAGNLGGSGYLLVAMRDGRTGVIDYSGMAPGVSKPGMFATPAEATLGHKSVAVPGTPAGLGLAHEKFGRLAWSAVLEPAYDLAKKGFPASLRMELILRLQVPVMKRYPEAAKLFLHGGDTPLKQGERLVQPELAATIARLRKGGWREFYQGETAKRIAADMAANGGFITVADLRGYEAKLLAPLRTTYRGFPVLTAPPSSSGGAALVVALNVLEQHQLPLGSEGSAKARHLQIEALRRGFAARRLMIQEGTLGVDEAISKAYAAKSGANLSEEKATPQQRGRATDNESTDTTHFTVVDEDGNIVSNTYTLSGFYGSQVIAKGTGVLLNNHMSVFSNRPGRADSVAPGKRYASTMAPSLIAKPDGTPWVAFGTPGGATIPSTLFQIVTNIVDFKMSLRDALEFPRIHFDLIANRTDAEPAALVYDVAERLTQMGHTLNPKLRSQGDVQAVMIEEGTNWRVGWSDGRRGGSVKGY
ncbi:MAG: gamma-glutamyltransferase [Bryobacteraceae bacterium]|nr:gamma-glutamyltransferase [Bryobacteraceae bacterium]